MIKTQDVRHVAEMLLWVTETQIKKPIEPHPFGLGVIMAKQKARHILAEIREVALDCPNCETPMVDSGRAYCCENCTYIQSKSS